MFGWTPGEAGIIVGAIALCVMAVCAGVRTCFDDGMEL